MASIGPLNSGRYPKTKPSLHLKLGARTSYICSLDPNFAHFLLEETTWQLKTKNQPTRGYDDDVPQASRRTAAQKVTHVEYMLYQIANFCPIVACNTIVKHLHAIHLAGYSSALWFPVHRCLVLRLQQRTLRAWVTT